MSRSCGHRRGRGGGRGGRGGGGGGRVPAQFETPAIEICPRRGHTQLRIATHRTATEPNPISRLKRQGDTFSTSDIQRFLPIY